MQPLYLVAVIRPRMEHADQVEATLRTMVEATLQEQGCDLYDLVMSAEEPDTWLMLEKWASRADWEAHMASPHNVAGNAILADLLREPTELRFYDPK